MGTNYSPKIVTDGLVLCLDAANPKSYPGSGTTWYDLSGNGNDGTLVNGVGYDSVNNGSMVFDGVDDYVITPFTRQLLGDNLTIRVFYKYSGVIDDKHSAIIGSIDPSGGTEFYIGNPPNGMSIGIQDGNYVSNFVTGSNAFDGNWHEIIYIYENNIGKVYLDGIFKNSRTMSKANNEEQIVIGFEQESYGYYYDGNISNVQFYNRALTDTEIKQNFNALRGRYGL